jgi:hypothetical protein
MKDPVIENMMLSQDPFLTNKERYLWTTATPHCKTLHAGSIYQLRDRLRSGSEVAYIPQFSRFPYKYKTTNGVTVNLIEVLTEVTGTKLRLKADAIATAKRRGDIESVTHLKDELPYVTASGIFEPRRNNGLLLPNFCMQLDIDKIQEAPKWVKEISKNRELEILFLTPSPSGNGVKGIIFLREIALMEKVWTPERYEIVFHKAVPLIAEYFKDKYNLVIDQQVKAISQPMYLSHFPTAFIHPTIRQWLP